MRFIASALFAAVSLVVFNGPAVSAVHAAEHPRYGGKLRIELHATTASLDPRDWKPGADAFGTNEKLAALVFDRLVTLDNYGRFQPQLAVEWSHDGTGKRWTFTLRTGAKFSDSSELAAGDVVAALQTTLHTHYQISGSGNTVVIQDNVPIPDLLEELASGRNFIYRVETDGTLLGTGPFFAAELMANAEEMGGARAVTGESRTGHMRFVANENCWAGRPFLNEIDVTLGLPMLRQLLDLQLGRAEIVDLSLELVRRATQENFRVWTSAPLTLLALRFSEQQPTAANEDFREALALALDRATMAGVLLQKQAEPASALLPQWLSGYAFLFGMETNLTRAKEIRSSLPANIAASAEPLRLRVDVPGDLAKLLGERVAVNARQAQLSLQIMNRPLNRITASPGASTPEPEAGLHLFAWRYSSLSPRVELDSFVQAQWAGQYTNLNISADPAQDYESERKLLAERNIIPLVALPEFVGIAPNVRDWLPARWAEWHLADVWLDNAEAAANSAPPGDVSNVPHSSVVPGAKP